MEQFWFSTRSKGEGMLKELRRIFVLVTAVFMLASCGGDGPNVLRLATTTSTEDSGLLEAILPAFEATFDARVDVVAVGTGQAIALGEAGDADIILVHAPSREDAFVSAGHGAARYSVMYNDFILVGPMTDPAEIQGMGLAANGLAAIAEAQATFASRGDDSGTHSKERALWAATGLPSDPQASWYKSLGQGMGDTLRFANESGAYTITDRGTFLSQQESLPNLAIMVGGNSVGENSDPTLFNPYGIIPVNPDKGNINHTMAQEFVGWLTSEETQAIIGEFGLDLYGQPLFYPDAD